MKCSKCKLEMIQDNFSWKNEKLGIRQHYCKACQKAYTNQHYTNNKNSYKLRAKRDKQKEEEKNRLQIERLKINGCIVCGEKRLPTLDFHHLDPSEKEENISRMTSRLQIEEEAKKCVVLCKNCHSIEHYLLSQDKTQLTWLCSPTAEATVSKTVK